MPPSRWQKSISPALIFKIFHTFLILQHSQKWGSIIKTGILVNCVFATFSKNIKHLTFAGCQSEIPLNSSQLLSIPYESEVLLPICYQIFDGDPDKGVEKYFTRMGLWRVV